MPQPLTRIAVLADIHGNLPALHAVVDDLARRHVEVVVNLGDHASGPLWPRETVAFLMQQSWVHIAGNHDRRVVSQPPAEHSLSDRFAFERLGGPAMEWLAALPATAVVGDEILLFHGTPTDDSNYLLETVTRGEVSLARPAEVARRLGDATARVMLCGHSHTPRVVHGNGSLIVNPGSVGLQASDNDDPEAHVMETGSPDARYAILERSDGGWKANLMVIPYEHQSAADRARSNDRPDWEIALRTGYMTA